MKILPIAILSLLLILLSCHKNENIKETVIVTVNNEHLTLEKIYRIYEEENWKEMGKEEQTKIINQWIELTLLAQFAQQDETIKNDPSLQILIENTCKKIYGNTLIAHEINKIEISNEELYNYYRLRQAEFVEQVREYNKVQRIFFRNENEMKRVKKMLDDKIITFTPAALQYSEEPIGRNGGFMSNLVTKSSPDSLLWKALNEKNMFYEVTMPYNNGWIIARWHEFRIATSNSSFYDVRHEIEQKIKQERQAEVFERLLKEARLVSNVIISY